MTLASFIHSPHPLSTKQHVIRNDVVVLRHKDLVSTVYCHTRVVGSSKCKNLQVAELQVVEESQDTEMDSDC